MYKFNADSFTSTIMLSVVCLLLSGCLGGGSNSVVKYYLVDPIHVEMDEIDTDKQLAVELIDLHIPQYLQRFQLVTRKDDNRLRFSDNNQWAENLRKNLLRTLATNLATRLSTIDIGTPLNRSATLPDYRVQVHIGQFELDRYGKVQLSGRWQITGTEEEEIGMYHTSLESDGSMESDNFDQVVADMQRLFAELSDQISDSIKTIEASKKPHENTP
jgi:uncharacterized lipoprotein YmbA